MSKPDITLQPSQRMISDVAARIYAAYVAAGRVNDDDVETWIKRSIREAAAIAKIIGASIESHDAQGIEESVGARPTTDARQLAETEKKSRMGKRKSRTSDQSEMTTTLKPRTDRAMLEELAEEALLENAAEHDAAPLELEEPSDTSNIPHSSPQPTAGKTGEPESKNDAATAANEALERISRETTLRAKK
jgi:DNA primase